MILVVVMPLPNKKKKYFCGIFYLLKALWVESGYRIYILLKK